MIYTCTKNIKITREEFDATKHLFTVNNLPNNVEYDVENDPDYRPNKPNTITDHFVWLFENGVLIAIDIVIENIRGKNHVYDDCSLYIDCEEVYEEVDEDEWEEGIMVGPCVDHPDPMYDIEETMEFEYEGDTYICKFDIVEEENEKDEEDNGFFCPIDQECPNAEGCAHVFDIERFEDCASGVEAFNNLKNK